MNATIRVAQLSQTVVHIYVDDGKQNFEGLVTLSVLNIKQITQLLHTLAAVSKDIHDMRQTLAAAGI